MYTVAGKSFKTPEAAISAQKNLLQSQKKLLEEKFLRNPIKKKKKNKIFKPREPHPQLPREVEEARIQGFYKMAGKIREGTSPLAAIEEMHATTPEWRWDEPEEQREESLKKVQTKILGSRYVKHRDVSLEKDTGKKGVLEQRWKYLEKQAHEQTRREKEREEEEEALVYESGPSTPTTAIASHKYNIWFINGQYLHPYLQIIENETIHEGRDTLEEALNLENEINSNKKDLTEEQLAIVIPQEVMIKEFNFWKYTGECLIPYLYAIQEDKELTHLGTQNLEKAEEIKKYLETQGEKVIIIPLSQEYGPNGEILNSLKPSQW